MKICIYGAGAIGGYLGAKLTEIGSDATLIARGPHYEAIRQDGLRLRKDGKELVVYPRCVDTAEKERSNFDDFDSLQGFNFDRPPAPVGHTD